MKKEISNTLLRARLIPFLAIAITSIFLTACREEIILPTPMLKPTTMDVKVQEAVIAGEMFRIEVSMGEDFGYWPTGFVEVSGAASCLMPLNSIGQGLCYVIIAEADPAARLSIEYLGDSDYESKIEVIEIEVTGPSVVATDADGDGVPDDEDQCPNQGDEGFGVDNGGCPNDPPDSNDTPDADGDGVPDDEDQCPNQGDEGNGVDQDGCPNDPPDSNDTPDADGDGVPDDEDQCPNQGDEGYGVDNGGCPNDPPDSDADGVPDDEDQCPNQGDEGYGVDNGGCPNEPPAPQEITISLCHATGDLNSPYIFETITYTNNTGHGHEDHEGDIVPAPNNGCPS